MTEQQLSQVSVINKDDQPLFKTHQRKQIKKEFLLSKRVERSRGKKQHFKTKIVYVDRKIKVVKNKQQVGLLGFDTKLDQEATFE